jgi:hypothetical protein
MKEAFASSSAIAFLAFALLLIGASLLTFLAVRKRRRTDAEITAAPPLAPEPARENRSLSSVADQAASYGTLICVDGPLAGRMFEVAPNGLLFGSTASAAVVIDDERVSREHLWVGVENGRVFAIDRGSASGTYLNRVDAPRIEKVALQPGDTLILADGAASFRYHR